MTLDALQGIGPRRPVRYSPRRAQVTLVALVVALALGLIGCGNAGLGGRTTTITGTFLLYDTDMVGCRSVGGYSDIGPGTRVTLTNESGTVLGSASLGTGSSDTFSCTWTYTFSDVSMQHAFYTVEVGRRGEITLSRDEMQASGWTFVTTLGL